MIQVVSAYLLIQRGQVTDDDPSHVHPKYVPKSRFKRWLLEDPLEYSKHLSIGCPPSSKILECFSTHRATLWDPYYEQTNTYTISHNPSTEFTTKDGMKSAMQLGNLTWGYSHEEVYTIGDIDSGSTWTDTEIRVITYYENSSIISIPFSEHRTMIRTAGVEPEPDKTAGITYNTLSAEYHKCPYLYDDWIATFYSMPIVNGVPIFSSIEAGQDYCSKVSAYRSSQTTANYEAVCAAIDGCINPD